MEQCLIKLNTATYYNDIVLQRNLFWESLKVLKFPISIKIETLFLWKLMHNFNNKLLDQHFSFTVRGKKINFANINILLGKHILHVQIVPYLCLNVLFTFLF